MALSESPLWLQLELGHHVSDRPSGEGARAEGVGWYGVVWYAFFEEARLNGLQVRCYGMDGIEVRGAW